MSSKVPRSTNHTTKQVGISGMHYPSRVKTSSRSQGEGLPSGAQEAGAGGLGGLLPVPLYPQPPVTLRSCFWLVFPTLISAPVP